MSNAVMLHADRVSAALLNAGPSEHVMKPWYHNGNRSNPEHYNNQGRKKPPPMGERKVIAWDMEGMNISGDGHPQHSVIFGCSEEPGKALVGPNLGTMEMLRHIVDVGERNPHSIHVGFGFRYDANMLIKDLPERVIISLWRRGHTRIHTRDGLVWNLSWIPGKTFAVSRWDPEHKSATKRSVKIYDYASFFGGQKFLTAAEDILRENMSAEDRETIRAGKARRGEASWLDINEVQEYWNREILLIRRVFETFRDVMDNAGFALKEWYGPGALANYINTVRGIRPHLAGAQVTSGVMPDEVHAASKVAFSGGRFELFSAGRHEGPIHAVDINGAYPFALTMVPSLHPDEGQWRHVESPDRVKRFGFYRITYKAPHGKPFESRPMPLFWRDEHGYITYPARVTGWYASPEARMVQRAPGVTIHEGWYWDSREEVFPWEFLLEMYATRQRLGKRNLMSLPFKLGPNSLYGKYAQTVGWNRKEKLPPRSHALPVAAWVTSFCRSQLWGIIAQIPQYVIGVETDSVFTTADPSSLNISLGNELGEWSAASYDEMLYLQSGMYHTRRDGIWSGTRSRGISRAELDPETSAAYLRSLTPGQPWKPLRIRTKPRFIGAGMAIQSAAPFKDDHCAWRVQERDISLGEHGKRRHVRVDCEACQEGSTPYERPHRLVSWSKSDGELQSHPRRLPWEGKHTPEVEALRQDDVLARELITR